MKDIIIRNASAHNLKNVSVRIPLGKFVAVVGKSGSGKSSFVYDVIYRASQGSVAGARVSGVPRTYALSQKVKAERKMSVGETNLARLDALLQKAKKGELLIVDEPCAGMAEEDRTRVLGDLRRAVENGVSMIVVEHAKDIIAGADHVIEFGPEAGAGGGEIVFQGSIEEFKKAATPTSRYVFSEQAGVVDHERKPTRKTELMRRKMLIIKGITEHCFKKAELAIPLGGVVCITGRIGAGKSTMLSIAYGALFKGKNAWERRQGFASVSGKTYVRRSYLVDQKPLSSVRTSTPATYLGIWGAIRKVYAALPESKKARLRPAHFSSNTEEGRKSSAKAKEARYKGVSVYDVLAMTVDEAASVFSDIPLVARKLRFLQEAGLGYLSLGQGSGTLSGGEAQRVRLAKILSKKLGDRCIYILDTPSRGLHLSDLPVLMKILQKIVDKNNTVLIAENREEIVQNCDHVIRL